MSSKATVHFVRHAPVIRKPHDLIYDKEAEVDLSCAALFQDAAARLPSPEQALWVSSPFPRAIITASKILTIKGHSTFKPKIVDGFEERRYGIFTGKTKSSLSNDPAYQALVKDPIHAEILGGESGAQLFNRVSNTIQTHIQNMKATDFLESVVVCHGGTIRAVGFYETGLPEQAEDWLKKKIPHVSVHTMHFKI